MYCIWLTFDSSDLAEIIYELAKKYNGPVFQPHCTLLGRTDMALHRIKSAAINLMSVYKPIEVHPKIISYTNNIWRAMYIELQEKQIFTNWHENICNSLAINCKKDIFPHISLMYHTISLREKEKLLGKIKLKSKYKIQSIQIVNCGDKVEEWKTIFELNI